MIENNFFKKLFLIYFVLQDSYNFLSSSIEKLTNNLVNKAKREKSFKKCFKNLYSYFKTNVSGFLKIFIFFLITFMFSVE